MFTKKSIPAILVLGFLLAYFLFIVVYDDLQRGQRLYIHCPLDSKGCENPVYECYSLEFTSNPLCKKTTGLNCSQYPCDSPILAPGQSIGEDTSPYFKAFAYVTAFLVGSVVVYEKRRKKLEVT